MVTGLVLHLAALSPAVTVVTVLPWLAGLQTACILRAGSALLQGLIIQTLCSIITRTAQDGQGVLHQGRQPPKVTVARKAK